MVPYSYGAISLRQWPHRRAGSNERTRALRHISHNNLYAVRWEQGVTNLREHARTHASMHARTLVPSLAPLPACVHARTRTRMHAIRLAAWPSSFFLYVYVRASSCFVVGCHVCNFVVLFYVLFISSRGRVYVAARTPLCARACDGMVHVMLALGRCCRARAEAPTGVRVSVQSECAPSLV